MGNLCVDILYPGVHVVYCLHQTKTDACVHTAAISGAKYRSSVLSELITILVWTYTYIRTITSHKYTKCVLRVWVDGWGTSSNECNGLMFKVNIQ